uniref:TRAF-type zinc finger domain-containing protein 1 n=1 Tax=Cacopsylla melanoneura TaxID=428564 RepID=A0A8D8SMV5_9HEMI
MEEAVQMETKLCDNCKKDVPVNNYLNHSIHCPRNIRLCPRCNEPYPIIEMESHIDQDHAEVVCPDCYEFMEAADLPSHKWICRRLSSTNTWTIVGQGQTGVMVAASWS